MKKTIFVFICLLSFSLFFVGTALSAEPIGLLESPRAKGNRQALGCSAAISEEYCLELYAEMQKAIEDLKNATSEHEQLRLKGNIRSYKKLMKEKGQ